MAPLPPAAPPGPSRPAAPVAVTCTVVTPAGTVKVCSSPLKLKNWVGVTEAEAGEATISSAAPSSTVPIDALRIALAITYALLARISRCRWPQAGPAPIENRRLRLSPGAPAWSAIWGFLSAVDESQAEAKQMARAELAVEAGRSAPV